LSNNIEEKSEFLETTMAQAPVKSEAKSNEGRGRYSSQQGRPGRRSDGPNRGFQQTGRPYRRQFRRRKVCAFCVDKEKIIDWKKFQNLRRILADSGNIYPRRKTGTCAKHQRQLAIAIKRARHLALLPFTSEHIRIMNKS
jgi:small subunit ribosomal protein S18